MRRFKQIDLLISIALIIFFTVFSLIRLDETFLIGYFVVGGWQVISMIVHAIEGCFTEKNGPRHIYHWLTFIIICMGVLSFLIVFFFFVYAVMLYAAPFMALFYTGMCYQELKKMEARPLAVIK